MTFVQRPPRWSPRWSPRWPPQPPLMVLTSGIPRSGTGWVHRILRSLLESGGVTVAARRDNDGRRLDDFPSDALDDAEMRRLLDAIGDHLLDPRETWLAKAHYFAGTPRTDHPAVRLVFVYRDLRDVMVSQTHWVRHGPVAAQFADADLDAVFTAVIDRTLPPAVEALRRVVRDGLPSTTMLLRYGWLTADPERWIAALAAHLGLALEDGVAAELVRRHTFAAEAGRQPGHEDPTSYWRRGERGRWGLDLPAVHLAHILRLAPDLDELLAAVDEVAR